MRHRAVLFSLAVLVQLPLGCQRQPLTGTWDFEKDQLERPPAGFTFIESGDKGEGWRIRTIYESRFSKVLTYPYSKTVRSGVRMALIDKPAPADLELSMNCLAAAGVTQACGLVLRHHDEKNQILARLDFPSATFALISVKDGIREPIARHALGSLGTLRWYNVHLRAQGDRFIVKLNDSPVIDAQFDVFRGTGRVGVWTENDSTVYFDDLKVRPLGK